MDTTSVLTANAQWTMIVAERKYKDDTRTEGKIMGRPGFLAEPDESVYTERHCVLIA
jgi:hypothetical protein